MLTPKTLPIWAAVVALIFVIVGTITGTTALSHATDTFVEEVMIANTTTCVGVGRYTLDQGVVFDSCTGRTYTWNGSNDVWVISIPAIPDIPRTEEEKAGYNYLLER